MARKLRGFERVLDAPALFAVAYGEIASSLYVALGIVAAQALGLTPLVLLLTGVLFLMVSLSYAEGTAALPETGGAATFVRRAFNDVAGFVTGWALLLDFLIVMALSALFLPHYLGAAISAPSLRDAPWDALIGCLVIAGIAAARLFRHTRLHSGALVIALLDLVVQGLLVLLGAAFLLSPETLREGFGFAGGQEWRDLAFALPLAMLAYTGLETASNLAEEAREPGRTLPRSLFSAIGLVVLVTVLIAAVGLSAYPVTGGSTALGDEWLEAPLVGIAAAFEGELPGFLVDALRMAVGISGALILLGAATTSMSGITRLTHSLAEHGTLPREFARLERRALVSSEAILIAAGLAMGAIVLNGIVADGDPEFLASVYSFGVLLAFTAAQLAVIWLRVREPALTRPFRARPEVTIRGHRLPLVAMIGAPLTFAIWVLALATHPGARYAGPLWLVAGLVVFVSVRRTTKHGLLEQVSPFEELPAGPDFRRILVPDEARRHRRGDGRDGDRAREGPRGRGARVHRRPRAPALPARGRAPARCRREGAPDARGGAGARARTTGSRCARRSCGRARSGTRSSRRPSPGAPTSSSSAPRRAGGASRASSRRPWTSCCGGRRARCSSSRSPTAFSSRHANSAPYNAAVKAVVIGCGRVGSAVAKGLVSDGWDVTVVDETEDALQRLGPSWRGGFVLGHGMDSSVLDEAGAAEVDAAVVATDGDNTNLVIGQVLQKRYGIGTVVVRVLDPARAEFYAERGLQTVCPTQTAISVLLETVRTATPLAAEAT